MIDHRRFAVAWQFVRNSLTFAGEVAMIISKITSKAQTTIPLAVRTALHLRKGDQVG